MKLSDIILLERRNPDNQKFAQLVNMSIKAHDSLSYEARIALDEWEHANWNVGKLSKSFREGSGIVEEIRKAFEPIRAKMRELFGDTITLHRGEKVNTNRDDNKVLFSFSFDENEARAFAYGRQKFTDISEESVRKAIEQYKRTGFVSFNGKKYKKLEGTRFYYIYDRRNNFITDGDNIERELMDQLEYANSSNQERKEKGSVYSIQVPVDKILWITNRLGSKEFITALNPRDV